MSLFESLFGYPYGNSGQQQVTQGTAQAGAFTTQYQGYVGYYNQGLHQQNYAGFGQTTQTMPPIVYNPIYPIAITHTLSGRKLIIWED